MTANPPVLVTGAAGFIGMRLVESLVADGVPVISVDAKSHFETRREHAGTPTGPIVDRDELFDWLAAEKPALRGVVHLGACTDTTELDVAFLDRVNVRYSQRIWEHCTEYGVPLAYASSGATYGDGRHGYDDDEARIPELEPLNPYGVSKQQFDLWALEQERVGRTPPAWCGFKFFNVYGFGERHKMEMASVALKAFDQIGATGKVRLFKSHHPDYADGEQKRDFIWVGDVVRVLRFALRKPIRRGIFNLGSGSARTWLDLARAVFAELGVPENIEFFDMPEVLRTRYQYYTCAGGERLRAEGYDEPFTSLEDGVRAYIPRLRSAAKA
jgi:ADP-L-glycero-D-manno-heptose 6-epimerase